MSVDLVQQPEAMEQMYISLKIDTLFSFHVKPPVLQRISNELEGTGAGLFIVKRMIEENGGKIETESSLRRINLQGLFKDIEIFKSWNLL